MEPTLPADAPAAPASGAEPAQAVPSFLEQLNAPPAAAPPPAAESTAAPTPATPTSATPPLPATPPAIADGPPAWLQELGGDYKSPDEVKAALAQLPALQKNQLTAEQQVGLRLLSEPERAAEYVQMLHTDYAKLDDEAVLLEAFRAARPGMADGPLQRLFHREQDAKFPGLAGGEETDEDYQADLAARAAEAKTHRATLTQQRDQQLAAYQQAALKDAGPTPAEVEAEQTQFRDAHLNQVKSLLAKGVDGFKLSVDVNGTPLHLAVEAKDLPAIQAILENPFAAFTKEDGTPNYDELKQYAIWRTQGPRFLALAQQAALEGRGPVVPLGELHNAQGAASGARPTETLSFLEQLPASGGGATRLRY